MRAAQTIEFAGDVARPAFAPVILFGEVFKTRVRTRLDLLDSRLDDS